MIKEEYLLNCISTDIHALANNSNPRVLDASPAPVLNTTINAQAAHTSAEINTTLASAASILVNNKGSSTYVEVALYCTIGTFPYTSKPQAIVELDASTNKIDIMFIQTYFDKFKLVISNKDGTNSTTVDYVIQLYGSA